jgi:hypothetical protein
MTTLEQMTPAEEEAFIKKEVEWTQKRAEEKYGEMQIAVKRWREAQFTATITKKALEDFYEANPSVIDAQLTVKE